MERERENIETEEEQWLEIPADLGPGNGSGIHHDNHPDLWALVMEARGIPCRSLSGDSGRRLAVPGQHYERALHELRIFEEENRNWPPPVPESSPLVENTVTTMSVLILLASFHNITLLDISLFGHSPVDWVALGSADSVKILNGQWWRTVTALTLHADWLHLTGNLAIGGFFIVFLCRDLGSGLAWSLLLGSGILGNLVNAYMQPYNHISIGASTLVFGAVGILAAISMVRHKHHPRKRWALPIAAALGLLALLGTAGENTDLGAHLFGFLFGAILGLPAEHFVVKYGRPARMANAMPAFFCIVVMVYAWWVALTVSP